MNIWVRRIRGALGMGVIWAIAWGTVGVALALLHSLVPVIPLDWFFRIFDAPAPAFALPGFVAGMLFSIVLSIAARNRKFSDLSVRGFAALGALGGLLLLLIPLAAEVPDLASGTATTALLQVLAIVAVPFALLGAASAAGMLMVAQRAERAQIGAGTEPAHIEGSR